MCKPLIGLLFHRLITPIIILFRLQGGTDVQTISGDSLCKPSGPGNYGRCANHVGLASHFNVQTIARHRTGVAVQTIERSRHTSESDWNDVQTIDTGSGIVDVQTIGPGTNDRCANHLCRETSNAVQTIARAWVTPGSRVRFNWSDPAPRARWGGSRPGRRSSVELALW